MFIGLRGMGPQVRVLPLRLVTAKNKSNTKITKVTKDHEENQPQSGTEELRDDDVNESRKTRMTRNETGHK
jgi:hypothetical protein